MRLFRLERLRAEDFQLKANYLDKLQFFKKLLKKRRYALRHLILAKFESIPACVLLTEGKPIIYSPDKSFTPN